MERKRQIDFMLDDLKRTRLARQLSQDELHTVYRINADYRLAENADTARLLVREAHGLLCGTEKQKLLELRQTLFEVSQMCDSIVCGEEVK